tara:strand:- start:137 stop:637 length:501 start_codon:yes stop_codon:yes gene_type:complete
MMIKQMKDLFELYDDNDIKRFYSHIDKRGEDECWPWLAMTSEKGYGVFSCKRKIYRNSRFMKLIMGEDIKNKVVKNTCGDITCCNPKHNDLITHAEVMQRMRESGNSCVGSKNRASKLTETDIRAIRSRYKRNSLTDGFAPIGNDYGVTAGCIRDIVIGKTWKHVD